jgi:hypothetical protein
VKTGQERSLSSSSSSDDGEAGQCGEEAADELFEEGAEEEEKDEEEEEEEEEQQQQQEEEEDAAAEKAEAGSARGQSAAFERLPDLGRYRTVVLLGLRVAAAFGLKKPKLFDRRTVRVGFTRCPFLVYPSFFPHRAA